jgi:small subunit ribosomal protein S15
MALTAEDKRAIMEKYGTGPNDSGSTAVQVALLTARLNYLGEHLQKNKKDHHSRRGLLQMVGQRRRLLTYLERENYDEYKKLIDSLGLRR